MTFREALDELKRMYGTSSDVALTYMINMWEGEESVSITAHARGVCESATTYEGALLALAAKLEETDDNQPPE